MNCIITGASRGLGKAMAEKFAAGGYNLVLIARDGGVLLRSGHTEAAVDLCKLAGLAPVAVICELANDDGTVMVGPQIEAFAHRHKLVRISVADLRTAGLALQRAVNEVVPAAGTALYLAQPEHFS